MASLCPHLCLFFIASLSCLQGSALLTKKQTLYKEFFAKPRRDREMDRVKIEEVQSTTKKQRIATHTHIKGLGLEVSLSFHVDIFSP